VLLDEAMPATSGLSLSRVIGEDSLIKDTKVILMSADSGMINTAENVHSWLVKPVRPSLLFNCLLKLLSRDPDTAGSDVELASPVSHVARNRSETRILVVEDNPTNQTLVKAQLSALGYAAKVVGDASQALDALLETHYDIVLMDCELPGMDGYEATVELRRREGANRHTSIVALTAHAAEADRRRCLAGCLRRHCE
jgi:two-component system sensor histidine kinase/response regulator